MAITNLVRDLHTNIATIQSIIAIYTLILASLTLLGGELQKVCGRKNTFLIGAVIYGVGTLVAAASLNSFMLLFGWSILEGIGGALIFTATFSIVAGSYSGKRRTFALGLTSSVASGAATVGPFIGGFLTTFYTWRYAFGLEFIIILVILLFSRVIPTFPPIMKWSDINIVGAINSGLGMFLLVYGMILLNNPNNWYISPIFIIIGVVLLIIFYINQKSRIKRDKHPLVDIRLFQNPSFNLGNAARFLMGFVSSGVRFIIPVFVQIVLGFSAFTTGLILIAMSISWFLISFTTSKVSEKLQPRYVISLGFLFALIGSIYLSTIFSPHTHIIQILFGISLIGLGAGIIFPHSTNLLFSTISRDKQPDASAIANTINNLTGSMGTAIIGLIVIIGTFNAVRIEEIVIEEIVGGMINAFYAISILLFIGIILSQFIPSYKNDN